MTLEQTALAEIQRVVDPEASEIDPIEPMNDGGWATVYKSGDRVFRLFYTPADGYEVFAVGEINAGRKDSLIDWLEQHNKGDRRWGN